MNIENTVVFLYNFPETEPKNQEPGQILKKTEILAFFIVVTMTLLRHCVLNRFFKN